MKRKKPNGSADDLANAFRDVIEEAVAPLKEGQEILLGEIIAAKASIEKSIKTNRQNNSAQFRAINKRLGKIEKQVSNL